MKYKYLEIVSHENSEEIVKRFDISDKSSAQVRQLEAGLDRRLDHNKYYLDVRETDEKLELR